MVAIYQEMDKKIFAKLMGAEDKMIGAEQLQSRENIVLYEMGEMWDILHFLLTGMSAEEPVEDDLLSEAIVGEIMLAEGNFVGCTMAERVQEIADALNELSFDEYLRMFRAQECIENDIYPNLSGQDEQAVREQLKEAFDGLKSFYEKMAKENKGAIVTIW